MPLRRLMRNLFLFIIFGYAGVGLTPVQVVAHGQLDEQIAAVTRRIQHDLRNAHLYLNRGELHRHHRKWTAARADYDRAARLAPTLAAVDLARARMWFGAGRPRQGKLALDRFLKKQPEHGDALVTRIAASLSAAKTY